MFLSNKAEIVPKKQHSAHPSQKDIILIKFAHMVLKGD